MQPDFAATFSERTKPPGVARPGQCRHGQALVPRVFRSMFDNHAHDTDADPAIDLEMGLGGAIVPAIQRRVGLQSAGLILARILQYPDNTMGLDSAFVRLDQMVGDLEASSGAQPLFTKMSRAVARTASTGTATRSAVRSFEALPPLSLIVSHAVHQGSNAGHSDLQTASGEPVAMMSPGGSVMICEA